MQIIAKYEQDFDAVSNHQKVLRFTVEESQVYFISHLAGQIQKVNLVMTQVAADINSGENNSKEPWKCSR